MKAIKKCKHAIGFIGFGEAAYFLSKGLINKCSDSIFAYDILWKTDPECKRSKKIKQLAIEIGVKPVYSYKDLSSNAQIIISAVTPSTALNAARQAARFIDKNKIYADINSKSPRATMNIWNEIRLSKAKFVDVAVMGSITKYGYKVPCLASGNGSEQFSKLNKYGMNIKLVGQEPGQASAIKMLRSIYTKGVAAVLYESFTAASEYNSVEMLFEVLRETEDSMNFEEMVNMRTCETFIHAKRRAEEMEMVCNMLRDTNMKPTMSNSTRKVLKDIARSGLKDRFAKQKPESFIDLFKDIKQRRQNIS